MNYDNFAVNIGVAGWPSRFDFTNPAENVAKGLMSPLTLAVSRHCIYSLRFSTGITVHG